jgi:type II secretory pathway pseudopilin PulG
MSYCAFCGNQVAPGTAVCPYCGNPPSGIRPPAVKGLQGGPLIIVIIAVVAVGAIAFMGMIAALLVPNFLDALQKAKQKRTVADMRELGKVLYSYVSDEESFPPAEDLQELTPYLVPKYVQSVPTTDGWQNPYRYTCRREDSGSEGCDSIRIVSAGRDGVFEPEDALPGEPTTFEPTDYDRDIVWEDGRFLQYPASVSPGPQ